MKLQVLKFEFETNCARHRYHPGIIVGDEQGAIVVLHRCIPYSNTRLYFDSFEKAKQWVLENYEIYEARPDSDYYYLWRIENILWLQLQLMRT